MTNLLINLDLNFWEANPNLKYIFSDLYNQDLSISKEESSKKMWFITMMYHPNSELAELYESERLDILKADYYKDLEWDEEENEPLVQKFKHTCLLKKKRFLSDWEKKLEERDVYMNSLPYNEDNFVILEKLMGNRKSLWDAYHAAIAEAEKEDGGAAFGGLVESLTEQGKI